MHFQHVRATSQSIQQPGSASTTTSTTATAASLINDNQQTATDAHGANSNSFNDASHTSSALTGTISETESAAAISITCKQPLKRFKLLSEDINMRASSSNISGPDASIDKQLTDYIAQVKTGIEIVSESANGLDFWQNKTVYPDLVPIAQDLITAPASQAYAERVFSLCGDMCAGKRNRTRKNLEKRVFLKMNKSYNVA